MTWDYEKLGENGKLLTIGNYTIDSKREYTGRYVVNVKAWFDENPGEAIARGWTKHIHFERKEIEERWPHDPQTQILVKSTRRVDEHTIEDDYHAIDKSEEMMRLQEMAGVVDIFSDGVETEAANIQFI